MSGEAPIAASTVARAALRSVFTSVVSNGLDTTEHFRRADSKPGAGAAKRETDTTRFARMGAR